MTELNNLGTSLVVNYSISGTSYTQCSWIINELVPQFPVGLFGLQLDYPKLCWITFLGLLKRFVSLGNLRFFHSVRFRLEVSQYRLSKSVIECNLTECTHTLTQNLNV